ncbi:MAG: threonine--tRNA ligase [Gammaproteobacteria bacterium]|nr:threonine--tRNA ligase [Gammaproteobacteria bacterium]
MPTITLPDGSQRRFDQPVTVAELAADIGAGLARAALAGRVNGETVDTSYLIGQDAEAAIITERDDAGLEILRHSCAHLLAQAVQQLFPGTQVTIGPVIDDGFYYDFASEHRFTPEDLETIENRMQEIVSADLPVRRTVLPRDEAIALFRGMGETYKAEIIADIPASDDISLYAQGEFTDLCRGPHVPSTSHLKAFKLTKIAGAYWRGDARNEMLQRIYGTAWPDRKALKKYLHRIEEASKRDHRKLGRNLALFQMQEEAPGRVFWHPKGWTLYQQVEQYIRATLQDHDYQEISTPQLVDRSLWEKSGHWDKFGEMIFTTHSEARDYAVKPMNCPCHVQIFNQGVRSYRELPLRLAEFGSCHRNEPSGTLHGLMRVRNFVQDDAHIFCTEAQIQDEVSSFIDLLLSVYADFGFNKVEVKLSTRPDNRVGSDEIWDKAEQALQQALDHKGMAWQLQPGEGAFYGPKIEFSLRDSLERVWQCGTIQVDFSMPARLDAAYIGEDGHRQVPVMLHRAILGSIERFIGILIEEHAGKLPLWLSPVQVMVMSITDSQAEFAQNVTDTLRKAGIRADSDLRNEKIGYKIREHTLQRVPLLVVVGDRELENHTLSVRRLSGEDLGNMAIDGFVEFFNGAVAQRSKITVGN